MTTRVTTVRSISRSASRKTLLGRLRGRLSGRDDSGQALVVVVVLLVLVAAIAPLMARQVTSDASLLSDSTDAHAALAAAEAGVQWYRDNLDSNTNYWRYTSSNPDGDAALTGWCGAGQSSTCDLPGTNPPEAFHYVPDTSQMYSESGGSAGDVVLTVTGRAGVVGHYVQVYARASFSTQSVLDDAYFSNYEVLDPDSQTIESTDVTTSVAGGSSSSPSETGYPISDYSNSSGTRVQVNPAESAWQLVCKYTTYSPNTFIDSLGLTINGTKYSASYPYYGPYYGTSSFSFTMPATAAGGATTVTVPELPCGSPYDFVSGETFSGPVYTNDQLHVCGSPDFEGTPVSLMSGASYDYAYLYDVPGSIQVTTANSGNNGPYSSSLVGDYAPGGSTVDAVNCNSNDDNPTLADGVELDGTQTLPTLNNSIDAEAGCIYVGPTMIELVTSGSTTTMDVWSPLSTNTSVTSTSCGTFSAASPFVTGLSLPSNGVIYVDSYTNPGSSPPAVPSDGSTPCFNPYQYAQSATSSLCTEGDVYIEGELHGQLTVGSAANMIITRDLTYYCADNVAGAASLSDPSSVSACTSQTAPDVLGLSAEEDVLISGNAPNNSAASTENCSSNGYGTGYGTASNSGTRINGTSYSASITPSLVWPTVCNPDNIVVDAAVFGVNGSFGVENWGTTPYSGDAYLNGADLSEYRGPFGVSPNDHGYSKEFSYDKRLSYVEPPDVLPTGVPLWQVDNYVLCETSACNTLQ